MATIVGGKNGAGVYQRIISEIPPHALYVEPFCGTAAILRHKRPARRSVAIDRDPGAIDLLGGVRSWIPGLELIVGDGLEYLRWLDCGSARDVFVYADPPYVRSSRRDPTRDYYDHEWDDAKHAVFLTVVRRLPWNVRVMISGYRSELYSSLLEAGPHAWRTVHFPVTTRGGEPAEEWLWMNYPRPDRLHDYRYIGDDYPTRWRIHKRQRSWLGMLDRMPELERRAMLAAVSDAYRGEVLSYLGVEAACCIAADDAVGRHRRESRGDLR